MIFADFSFLVVTGPDGISVVSVSYTQLDGYKRQLRNSTEESVRKTMVNFSINEKFIATRWKDQMIVRYVTRMEIILHTREIRTISTEEIMDHG